jgi:hypothetical protein
MRSRGLSFLSFYDAFSLEEHRPSPCRSCDICMISTNGAVRDVNLFIVHSLAGDSGR